MNPSAENLPEDVQTFLASKPHSIIAFSWVSSWMQHLHYLLEAPECMREYHTHLSKANSPSPDVPFGQHMLQCVYDFFDYFFSKKNLILLMEFQCESLSEKYGNTQRHFPLAVELQKHIPLCTVKEKLIFRSFTIDVFLAVVNPAVARELNIEWTQENENLLQHLQNPSTFSTTGTASPSNDNE